MPSEQHDTFIDLLRAGRLTSDQPVAEQRAGYALLGALLPAEDNTAVHVDEVDCDGIPAELLTPASANRDGAVLWLHGGGYTIGGPESHRPAASALARMLERSVLLVDYRLAPEHPFPAALEDATRAWRWLCERHRADEVVVVGDSAGGGLALALVVDRRDHGDALPAAAAVLSPWVDLAGGSPSLHERADRDPLLEPTLVAQWAENYAGSTSLDDPRVSPLHADLRGLPPLLVTVGTEEILYDDALRLAERASEAGVDVTTTVGEGMIHIWQVFAGAFPESTASLEAVARWLAVHLPES